VYPHERCKRNLEMSGLWVLFQGWSWGGLWLCIPKNHTHWQPTSYECQGSSREMPGLQRPVSPAPALNMFLSRPLGERNKGLRKVKAITLLTHEISTSRRGPRSRVLWPGLPITVPTCAENARIRTVLTECPITGKHGCASCRLFNTALIAPLLQECPVLYLDYSFAVMQRA